MAKRSSDYVLSTYDWITKLGARPLPLVPGSKAAAIKDYQAISYTPEPRSRWEEGEYGIGMILGPQRDGLIDFDLDCDEAIALAPYILPPTGAVFGRPGKPRSHYMYRLKEDTFPTKVFKDKISNKNILEMRGDGGNQTVMPGSIHEGTGELVAWADPDNNAPSDQSEETLIRAGMLISYGVLVLRYVWKDGFRNDPTLPLVGILAKAGVDKEDVQRLFEALGEVSGSTDQVRQRTKTINLTYTRFEKGDQPVAGTPKLLELLGSDAHAKAIVGAFLNILGSRSMEKLEEYNQQWACVMMGGQKIVHFPKEPTGNPEFTDKQGFLDWYAEDFFTDPETGKPKKWAIAWLNSPQRNKFDNIDFLPGMTEDHPDWDKHSTTYNLWSGWKYPTPRAGDKPEGSCEAYLELLRDVVCETEEEYNWVLHFFAQILRDPMNLSRTALVIRGKHGSGKSLSVNYFGRILGSYYYVASDENRLVGQFNSHIARTLLLHSEEALFSGNPKHKNYLKTIISDEWRTWEAKNVNAKQVRNFMRIVLTSNEPKAAPVEIGDRRYTIIDTGDRKPSQDLIDRVVAEMNGNGPEALLYFLLHELDYDPMVPQKIIHNKAHKEATMINLNPVQEWWKEKLESGEILMPGFEWCKENPNKNWDTVVSSAALYFDFLTFLNGRNSSKTTDPKWSSVSFQYELRRLTGAGKAKKEQKIYNRTITPDDEYAKELPKLVWSLSNRQRSYVDMPSLAEARDRFDRETGGTGDDWPDDIPHDEKPAYLKAADKAREDADRAGKERGF